MRGRGVERNREVKWLPVCDCCTSTSVLPTSYLLFQLVLTQKLSIIIPVVYKEKKLRLREVGLTQLANGS